MLMVIDVGNTQTALGLFEGSELQHTWRITTTRDRTVDEMRLLLAALLDEDGFAEIDIEGVAVSSVVPNVTAALRGALPGFTTGDIVFVGPGVKTGMPIRIDNPREVGADRVVNSISAIEDYGAPVVVVDFGTATTFDVVSRGGEYVGGAIAPGLNVSFDALVQVASALSSVDLGELPPSPIGKNTAEAMQSGMLYGYAGLVDGIMNRIVHELGGEVPTVGTGGIATMIVPLCQSVEHIDESLTLRGLRLIYERNQ